MLSVTSIQLESWISAYAWPFLRILALFSAAPLFNQRAAPTRLKVGLAALIAFVVVPGLPQPPVATDPAWLFFQQLAIGLAIGLALHVMFAAFSVAGDLLGLQMGLSFASFIDPQRNQAEPIVGSFLGLLATLVFLSMNGHLILVAGIAESFRAMPVGGDTPLASDWKGLALLGGTLFTLGVHMALPVLATMLILNLALGVLARVSPQLNLFAVGFPATILVGLLALALAMPLMGPFLESVLERGVAAAFSVGR
jgi:flagellar biosynthetic protein FliR